MRPFDPRLLRTAPAARRPVAVLAVVGVLQGVATIGLTFALTALVVAVVEDTPLRGAATWLAVLFAVRAALGWVTERVAAWVGVEVTAALREGLLVRWLSAPAERRPDPDRAVTLAAQGAASVEPYAARFLPALVAAVVVPALAVATLVRVDPVSALIVVLTLPLLPFFAALIGKSTQAQTERRWTALSSLSGHFLDVMRGLPTLVGYGRAERQVEVIGEVSQQHRRATMQTLRLAFMSSAALELLASISVAIVAVTVGLRLTHGSMTLQAGLLAILLAPEAYWPIRRVGAEFHAAADGAEAIAGILVDLEAPSTAVPTPSAAAEEVGLSLHGVSYTYPGAHAPVLTHLTLAAGPGLTAVTGPSGVGKSTLLELVAGLRRPDAGTVDAGRAHLVTQRPFLPAGGPANAVARGEERACRAIQFFNQSPRAWRPRIYSEEEVAAYHEAIAASEVDALLIHAVYLLNCASEDEEIRAKSLAALISALDAGAALDAVGVVLHPGSALKNGGSVEKAIERAGAVIREALEESADGGILHLEDTAGAGGTLGRSFEELAALIEAAGGGTRIGVCLDSCHLLASGYDIRSADGLSDVLDRFDEVVGLDRLGSLHVNDSMTPLGSNRDRHANLGEGEIGPDGIAAFLSEPRFDGLPMIFEGPGATGKAVERADIENAIALRERGLKARG